MMRVIAIGGLLVALATCAVAGDDARVEASVDRTSLPVGETLTLTITVYGGDRVGEPNVENVEGFEVVGRSTSRSISIVNMQMSKSLIFQYTLLATTEGSFSLGPFEIKVDDMVLETEPIDVVVTKSLGSQPQARPPRPSHSRRSEGKDVLLIASVDKDRAYVGEQVTYTLKFAYRVRLLGDTEYIPPEHKGFWSEDLGQSGPTIEVINGQRYYVITKRIALFPISSGELSIGEAAVRYVVERDLFSEDPFAIFRHDPFDMFRGREGIARSQPIQLEVLPLPPGAPSDFSGAVGRFSVSVKPSAREVKVGESITLSIKIEGEGSLQSVGDIPLPEPQGFKVFAPKARESKRVEGTRVYGTKIYDLVLVPQHPGEYRIGGFDFTYFDPRQGKYVTATAEPVAVKVLPGELVSGTITQTTGAVVARRDIRYIRKSIDDCDEMRLNLGGETGLLVRLSPFAIVIVGVILSLARRRAVRTGRAIAGRALKHSMRELDEALKVLRAGRSTDAAARAAQAIRTYLGARLGRSSAAIQVSTIEALSQVEPALRSEIVGLLDDLDRIRFAPVGHNREEISELIEKVKMVLRKVDRQW